MYDMAVVNREPGQCEKCKGTGQYRWGASINGKSQHGGTCFSCQGTGKQDKRQIRRNAAYNRHKLNNLSL